MDPRHIISTKQFNPSFIDQLFTIADGLDETERPLHNKIMASLFYEPSTRTRFSFETAALRLGGQIITSDNMREASSIVKGESLEDTIKVLNNYADVIVLRHNEQGSAARAAAVSQVPVINAGDGTGEHPTQALLDVYTIQQELHRLDNLCVAIVGDLKNGRTVHSLIYLLAQYPNLSLRLVSPRSLQLPQEIKQYLHDHKVSFAEMDDLSEIISEIDVLYQTRVQKERFDNKADFVKVKDKIILTKNLVQAMPKQSVIMHPLPRTNEIPTLIDTDHRAVYFKQTAYGLKIRKALLKYLFIS